MPDDDNTLILGLVIAAIDHTPLTVDASYDEVKAQYVALAEVFLAEAPDPVLTTDPETTGWPSDETLESFLTFLRGRGWRLLDKPAGLYA